MSRRAFRLLPHTADLRVEALGEDLPEALAAAAEALFSLLVDRRTVREAQTRTVRAGPGDPEELLFRLLREALLLFFGDRFLACRAHVTMDPNGATLSLSGEPFDPSRHRVHREVKAVTAHGLSVRVSEEGVAARFVVDV